MDREQAATEIISSRTVLERLLNQPVTSFAYPKGAVNEDVRRLVIEAGFRQAVGIRERPLTSESDPFDLPRINVGATTSELELKAKLTAALDSYQRCRRRLVGR
jgi:peptidoglycan/xylan/chitin deacetylase (PgdA/CDA1 family)